jgi:hypothetical protein
MQSAIQTGKRLCDAYLLWGIIIYVYYMLGFHRSFHASDGMVSFQSYCLEAEVHEPGVQRHCE